ncbi:hybrid sensor histidine kinase/response regulator [Microvirga antarctica]|uniref:hybrid sensor histidine kinase/response regulator n=1 Tax=Microvirga antarctica TaxID=2819233 RepID=UPI001B30408B|nr:PAS domain-containing sensor histidine kinase [Microvirga antarctica]
MTRLRPDVVVDFGTLFDVSPNPYILLSPEMAILGMNAAYLQVTMRLREEILGRNIFEAFPGTPDELGRANVAQLRDSLQRVVRERTTDHIPLIHYDIPRPDGTFDERYWSATHTPILAGDGSVAYILQHTVDVTELHHLRQASRLSEGATGPSAVIEGGILNRARAVQQQNEVLNEERQHLRRLFEQAPGFTAVLRGPSHIFEMANAAYIQVIGQRDIIGKTVAEALPEVSSQGFIELLDQVYASGQPFVGRGLSIRLRQNPSEAPSERFLDFVYQPIHDAAGKTVGIFVLGNDITEQKRAEDELRDYREHLERLVHERTQALEESETHRRQAQKMEAIGQLTGGVAHDFNNLLAIVIGNVELAKKRVVDPRVDRLLENAMLAGERGAKLTRQLLAFARQQALSLEPTDIVQSVHGMQDLLLRTIGPSIEISTELAPDLWPVITDRNQLEVALLNLAINARDAMPSGGKLVIAAENAQPADLPGDLAAGDYVRISVRDDGTGIPEELRTKVFEPFFTTKDLGKGTGLGLSQIYGFVKQQGGSLRLKSAMGLGTEVALYLPRTGLEPLSESAKLSVERVDGQGAHVLVIDDDTGVRSFITESLRECGYQVSEAKHGVDGLNMLAQDPDIELVVVDFAMPSLDGLGFIDAAREAYPDLPIVLMTGYAEAERLNETRLKVVPTILKPFSIDTLLTAMSNAVAAQES